MGSGRPPPPPPGLRPSMPAAQGLPARYLNPGHYLSVRLFAPASTPTLFDPWITRCMSVSRAYFDRRARFDMAGNPTASIRLQVASVRLLEPGFKKIMTGLKTVKCNGINVNTSVAMILGPPKCSTEEYDEEVAEALGRVFQRLYPVFYQAHTARRVRLTFDYSGFAGCLLAARVSRRLAGPGPQADVLARLENRFECSRRRAVRAFKTENGAEPYAKSSSQWRAFERWLRFNVLRPGPRFHSDPTRRPPMPRWDKNVVRWAMDAARNQLTDWGESIPAEPELRRLVRLAIWSVRRRREPLSVKDLIFPTAAGAIYLASFICARVQEKSTTAWPDLAQ